MRKRLGQHFLKDKKTLRKIVSALEIDGSDTVIEIGPGHGELTKEVLEAGPKKVVAIEKDKELVDEVKYLPVNNLEVIEGDALRIVSILSNKLQTINYKLTGNIPFYITGHLLRKLGELEHKPELIVLTIQKEVAERICAEPPRMNLLAASVQFWAEPEIIDYVSKNDFRPMPKVDSAIIKLKIKTSGVLPTSDVQKLYYRLIKVLFKQPRKTILNNLADGLPFTKTEISKKLAGIGLAPGLRAQNLSLEELTYLTNVFYDRK